MGPTTVLEGFKRLILGGAVNGEMYMGLEGERLDGDCDDGIVMVVVLMQSPVCGKAERVRRVGRKGVDPDA